MSNSVQKVRNHFRVSAKDMESARRDVGFLLSELQMDAKAENLSYLLFEEASIILEENLPPRTTIDIRLSRAFRKLTFSFSTEKEILPSSRATDGNDEIENSIRSVILENNEERIKSTFRRGRQRITILLGEGHRKRDCEKELSSFYDRYKDNPPSALCQLLFIFGQHKWGFLLSIVVKLIRTSPTLIIPIVTANIIDIVSTTGILNDLRGFLLNISVAAFSLLLNILFAYLDVLTLREIILSIGADLRNLMVRKLQFFSISYHSESKAGTIVNKMLTSVEEITGSIYILTSEVILIAAYCSAAILLTLLNCPLMALFYIFFIPLAVIVTVVFRRPIGRLNQKHRKELEETNAVVIEMLDMVEMTRAHGLQKKEMKRMGEYVEELHVSEKKLETVNQVFGSISWVSLQFFQLLALSFSAFLATRNVISIGMIALFQSYFTVMVNRLSTLINNIPRLAKGIEGFNSISEVLCADAEENNGSCRLADIDGNIEFLHMDYAYKQESRNFFTDFSLSIPARTSVAFVGGSGSGKTTLINMIIGFLHPSGGKLLIDGKDIKELDLSHYRNRIAVVPQYTVLFSGTLMENLTYGSPYVSTEQVWNLLKAVGLDEFVKSLPDGLDTMIKEGGANLSGGQKQRLAIVRALLRDARILILDEATSALDNVNERLISDVLDRIKGKCTIVMIAHRPSTIKNVDNIVFLERGRIAEQGRYNDLMEKKGAFYEMFSKEESNENQ